MDPISKYNANIAFYSAQANEFEAKGKTMQAIKSRKIANNARLSKQAHILMSKGRPTEKTSLLNRKYHNGNAVSKKRCGPSGCTIMGGKRRRSTRRRR